MWARKSSIFYHGELKFYISGFKEIMKKKEENTIWVDRKIFNLNSILPLRPSDPFSTSLEYPKNIAWIPRPVKPNKYPIN